jgi:protein-L-isoaspartate O-methyltransferase
MNKEEMIESVSNYLSYFDEIDFGVLHAMNDILRENFYHEKSESYLDIPLESNGTVVIQPSVLGRMVALLKIMPKNSVLEIGAGTGWTASVLAYLSRPGKVLSLDIGEDILEIARTNSSYFNLKNLNFDKKDFWDIEEEFDKIIFSCGVCDDEEHVIIEWIESHLKDRGRAVFPHVEGPLVYVEKIDGEILINQTPEEYCFDALM